MFPLHETEASGKPQCRRPLERGAILEVNHHGGSFWMMINPYQSYYKNGGFVNYPLNNGGWKGNARFQKGAPWVVLKPLELGWWFRSPARKPPVIYQALPKMAQDFFHPQFHLFCGSGRSLFWAAPCHVEGDHFWELCGNLYWDVHAMSMLPRKYIMSYNPL